MKLLKKIFVLVLIIVAFCVRAQDSDPVIILDSAQNKISSVAAYTADAEIDVDVDFLKMEPRKAKITYKYPNKLDVDAKGFLMIPKYGFRPYMKTISAEDNMAVFAGREEINGNMCYVLKLLPRADGKIIMMKLWIRLSDYLVQRSETFTRRSGNFLIDFTYEDEILPSEMVFHFETKGLNLPWKLIGNSIEADKSDYDKDEIQQGSLTIKFANYNIQYQ